MGKKKRYKLFKNGKYVGTFYASEICEMTGITAKVFYNYVTNKWLYKGCYTFEKVQEINYTQEELELMKQWDKYRKILNPNAKETV